MNVGKCLIFPVTGRHVGENWARDRDCFRLGERSFGGNFSRSGQEKLQ